MPSAPSMNYSLWEDFESAKPDWLDLEASGHAYPFQSYPWLKAWHETVGKEECQRLAILGLRDASGRIKAILPLGLRRKSGLPCLSFLGGALADYNAPLVRPGAVLEATEVRGVLRRVARGLGAPLIVFSNLPALLADGSPNPLVDSLAEDQGYASHQCALAQGFEPLFEAAYSAKSRYNLRRSEKLLAEAGECRLVLDCQGADRQAALEALFAFKSRRYRETGALDLFAQEGYKNFYRRLDHEPGLQVLVSSFSCAGTILAVHWGVVRDGRLYYLMPAYADGDLARHSPGKILARYLVEEACLRGLSTVDFTIGDEDYKKAWCQTQVPLYRRLEGSSLPFRAAASLRSLLKAKKKKNFPSPSTKAP